MHTRDAAAAVVVVMMAIAPSGGAVVSAVASAKAEAPPVRFEAPEPGETLATITVSCDACAWDTDGREAVVLTVSLDRAYSQHLPVVRSGRAEYHVAFGSVDRGSHTIDVAEDPQLTARELVGKAAATVESIRIQQITAADREHLPIALAPVLYARADTVGHFTDVPVFMWYEVEPTTRGTRYRYSVIFTNEDGGTPADRLMATWGRTTDIEYVYSVEVDLSGRTLSEDMQAPKHEILPFHGKREGRHPLLWVSTSNNMVLDTGTTRVRYAPAPVLFPLNQVSREAVMDRNPWLYEVMTKELVREGKIVDEATPGKGTIPHPLRFAYLEGCGEIGDNALAFAVRIGENWIASDYGLAEYRIMRDGCFRAAIPLPHGASVKDIRAVRVQAFARTTPAANPRDPRNPRIHFTRLNALFGLDERFVPSASIVRWQGAADLAAGEPPLDIPIP